jgi:hypothetical protein
MAPPLNSSNKNKNKTVPPLIINKNRIIQEYNRKQSDSNDSVFDENKQNFNIV